jgi:hypothetical protein
VFFFCFVFVQCLLTHVLLLADEDFAPESESDVPEDYDSEAEDSVDENVSE